MAYKISGTTSADADIYVVDEGTDLLEVHQFSSAGAYTVENLSEGPKIITAMAADGQVIGYGNVTPEYSVTYEDFRTYTEAQDWDNDITVAENTITASVVSRTAWVHVYYDFGAGILTSNMKVNFEVEITYSYVSNCGLYLFGISNTIGNGKQCGDANDHIALMVTDANNLRFGLGSANTDNWDYYYDGGSTSNNMYCTFTRSGSTATIDLYSDVARETLVDSLSIVSETGSKRYLYAVQGWGQASGIADVSAIIKNFNVVYLN